MAVTLTAGAAGLPLLRLAHPAGSSAELYLHGAHLTSWVPAGGEEAIFLSRAAELGAGSAIRGGIPVVFPQFASLGPLPKHGFARTREWAWREEPAPADAPRAVLELRGTPELRALWPHDFLATLTVSLGERELEVELAVANPGRESFRFTAALHTYLRVADAGRAALLGLRGARYRSATEGVDGETDPEPELRAAGELDRVYLDAPAELRLLDRAAGRSLRLRSAGFRDVVVWNPGPERARALPDLAPGEEREMLCVEAAQVGAPVELAPGESWRGAQRLEG